MTEFNSVRSITLKLFEKIKRDRYAGFDPYDALNSPILNFFSFGNMYLRIFFTQLLKRFPINLRLFLLIKKGVNPKTIGLLIDGISILHEIGVMDGREILFDLLEILKRCRSPEYSRFAWGYNFPWQSRVFYLPPYTPTIVNTSFIGLSLLKAYEVFGYKELKEMGIDSALFIVENINRSYDGKHICFSYTPVDHTMIHNANLLGATLILEANKYLKREDLEDLIHRAFGYTLKYQNEDGSWFYAQKKFQNWIDNFHTGFVLDSLLRYYKFYPSESLKEKIFRGYSFYKNNFFEKGVIPKYYSHRTYPVDIHSISQSIITLTNFSEFDENFSLLDGIFKYLVDNFYSGVDYFYYRKYRFFRNRIDYMRWSQAWCFRAMCYFLRFLHERS